jgi:hypothetical protein
MYPPFEFGALERALLADHNRDKKLKESFKRILLRVVNEKVGVDTKRGVIAKNFVRLFGQGNLAATNDLLKFLDEESEERWNEACAEQQYRTLLEAAKKKKSKKSKGTDPKASKKEPPNGTRFAPGQSGNPAGRPRKPGNYKSALFDAMNEEVPGKNGSMTRLEMLTRDLVDAAVEGKPRHVRIAHTLMLRFDTDPDYDVEEQKRLRRAVTDEWRRDFDKEQARRAEARAKKERGARNTNGADNATSAAGAKEAEASATSKSTEEGVAKAKAAHGSASEGPSNAHHERGATNGKVDAKVEEPVVSKPAPERRAVNSGDEPETLASFVGRLAAERGPDRNPNPRPAPPVQKSARPSDWGDNSYQLRINPKN